MKKGFWFFGGISCFLHTVGFGLLLTLVAVIAATVYWLKKKPQPQIYKVERKCFGSGNRKDEDESIRPFKINVPDEVLKDLKIRLDLDQRLTPPLQNSDFEYGFNSNYLQEIIEFWKTKYNWREREAYLNKFPHYKTSIDGLDIHFIHVKPRDVPKTTKIIPLLLNHGWPGSVREFYDIIPLLTTPRDDSDFVFEVVAPSLPGYGFSEGAKKQGMNTAQIALIMEALMHRLGFKKFYTQGGDWGSAICIMLGLLCPDSLIGIHLNLCMKLDLKTFIKNWLYSFWPTFVIEKEYVSRAYPIKSKLAFLLKETGYMHIQATKPDTVGVALQNSPSGLAAYILEKFSTWTDPAWRSLPDGGLTKKYSLTDLLDNVMIYWVTNSITTSVRLYKESFRGEVSGTCFVPTAVAMFPNDLAYPPKSIVLDSFPNLVQYNHMPRGGHFAAMEEPKLLAEDLWAFVKKNSNNA